MMIRPLIPPSLPSLSPPSFPPSFLEQYPTLRRISSGNSGSYRDKIAWLKAGGEPQQQEAGKEGGEQSCNLVMTVNMDVCGDFRQESCYFLGEPQYTRVRDLARCWMLKMKPEDIPRLVWDKKGEAGEEGGVLLQQQQQERCYNVAVHLRVGDANLHQTDVLFFENLKQAVGVALVGFECVHYHFFYEEEAMIQREKEEEEKKRVAEMLKKEQEEKAAKEEEERKRVEEEKEQESEKVKEEEKRKRVAEKEEKDEQEEEVVLVAKEKKNKKRKRVEKRRLVEGEPPFPILTDIFKEEVVVVEEEVAVEEKKREVEGREEEGLATKGEEEGDAEETMERSARNQRIRVSYHGRMDVRSTLYHFMDADMLVATGSSFPYMAALLSPKPVILMAPPKEAIRGGPRGEGSVGGYWFGGYGMGGRDGGIALLTDQGKVVSPETDTEWRAMVEMKYLDAAGRRVPYV